MASHNPHQPQQLVMAVHHVATPTAKVSIETQLAPFLLPWLCWHYLHVMCVLDSKHLMCVVVEVAVSCCWLGSHGKTDRQLDRQDLPELTLTHMHASACASPVPLDC